MELIYTITGSQLKTLRLKSGMTQRELGAQVGISASRVSAYERAVSRIPLHLVDSMATALGTELKLTFIEHTPGGTFPFLDTKKVSGGLIQ